MSSRHVRTASHVDQRISVMHASQIQGQASEEKIPFVLILLGLTFILERWFGDYDIIGAFSPRVFLLGFLGLYVAFATSARRSFFSLRPFWMIMLPYVVVIIWLMVAQVFRGEKTEQILSHLFGRHFIALLIFFLITRLVRTYFEIRFLTVILVGVVAVSSLVAALQWMDIQWGKDLWFSLRGKIAYRTNYQLTALVPGLAATPFALGYELACLGLLPLAFWFERKHVILLSCFALCVIGVLVVQQRSALLAMGFSVVVLVMLSSGIGLRGRRFSFGRAMQILIGCVVVVLIVQTLLGESGSASSGYGSYALNRFSQMHDEGRFALLSHALDRAWDDWLIGIGGDSFVGSLVASTDHTLTYLKAMPHNIFLNSLIMAGLPGLVAVVIMVSAIIHLCYRTAKSALRKQRWIIIGLCLGCVGYIINAQAHNSSFITGDSLPWWVLSLVVVYSRLDARGMG